MKSKEYRKWRNPRAEKLHLRSLAHAQQKHEEQVEDTAHRIAVAITLEGRIVAFGREELLLRLAKLIQIRLYDSGIDNKLKGHARQRQGDRYKVMHQALNRVIDTYDDILLTVDHDSQVHIFEFVPNKSPTRQQLVIQEDGLVLLPDACRAQLREWGEPDLQYA